MSNRRRLLFSNSKNRNNIVAGDILCAQINGDKIVIDAADYASIPSDWTPIGVVVIPPSHNVYGTGEGAAISLKWMDYNDPDNGSLSDTTSTRNIYFGGNYGESSANFGNINLTDNNTPPTISYPMYVYNFHFGYLPIQDSQSGIICSTDSKTAYDNTVGNWLIPSPYLNDGSRNPGYYTTEYSAGDTILEGDTILGGNALSDFNGKSHTNYLIYTSIDQYNWRTASTITNEYSKGYSPAACCCWRYHTIGTNQGDWYMPAMGEIGYGISRRIDINNSMTNIGGAPCNFLTSSTQHTVYMSLYVFTCGMDGYVEAYEATSYPRLIRPFIRF